MARPKLSKFDKNLRAIISTNIQKAMNGMTQATLSDLAGIPASTLSGYIAMRSTPPPDQVQKIADALGINKSDIDPRFAEISDTELKHISVTDSPNRQRLETAYTRLNDTGQGKVADYADDLDKSGQYRRTDELTLAEPVAVYSVAKAAAGDGEHYDGYQDAVYHRVRSEDIPPHDDAIDVIGTSMEPTIHDGDVAFVVHDFERRDGAIYAVSLDDEIVIKRVYFDRHSITLVSDNEEYKDRVIHESDFSSVHLSGRVVGWATPEE